MPTVAVELPHHRYNIVIEPGLLDRLGEQVTFHAPHASCALIADQEVMDLYGRRAANALGEAGYDVQMATLDSGESHKNLDTVRRLYDFLLNHRMERRSPVIALGGGVTGDTVGFVAATYLRGVPFIQCPTTLLAMVDASVGGKVGVNVPQGKNLIGAFHQPHLVAIDPLVLQTLPPRQLRCGLAECVKHGVIRDPALFDWIAAQAPHLQAMDPGRLTELIEKNVRIKAAVVMADEKESGERAHLNFGHTFAHAIEALAGYGHIQHGEAVSLGMVAAAWLAVDRGLCDATLLTRLKELLARLGLPVQTALPPTQELMASMLLDKKVADQAIRLILPEKIGSVTIRKDIPADRIAAAWEQIRHPA